MSDELSGALDVVNRALAEAEGLVYDMLDLVDSTDWEHAKKLTHSHALRWDLHKIQGHRTKLAELAALRGD
jgi:hypothetical protein